jgi:hypothetical protein
MAISCRVGVILTQRFDLRKAGGVRDCEPI